MSTHNINASVVDDIEHQYMPSNWSKRYSADKVIKVHLDFVKTESELVKSAIQYTSIRYGKREGQIFDIFGDNVLKQDSDIFVYLHGGYWQSLSREISSYCVTPLHKAGIKAIIPDYDLAPNVNLTTIVTEIKELANFVLEMAESHSCSVWFGGHSAGAHLAAQLLNDEYLITLKASQLKLLRGLVLISGVYDLAPLVNTSINKELQFTRKEIEEYSPLTNRNLKLARQLKLKVLIAVAENDSPEFHKQTESFTKMLQEEEVDVECTDMDNDDHFSIVENLKDHNHLLTKRIISLIKTQQLNT